MNAEKKWYHAHQMVFHEKHKQFGDEAMFHIFKDWLTDAEAEASGLDEF